MAGKNELVVETKSGTLKVVIMDITPSKAKSLLRLNTNNRNLRENRLEQYAYDMKSGRWYANGVPIVISNEGELKDGQHRLQACVKAGVTLKNCIILYLPEEQANCYDVGANRTARDLAMYMGLDESPFWKCSQMYGVVNMAMRGERLVSWHSVSKMSVIEKMRDHSDACNFVYRWIYGHYQAQKLLLRKSPYAAAVFNAYVSGYDLDKLKNFVAVMVHGICGSVAEEPIIRCRDLVLQHKAISKQAQRQLYLQVQEALHTYAEGLHKADFKRANTEYYSCMGKD